MKILTFFSFILLCLQGCSNEDWNRIDERVGGVSIDVISKKNPYDDYEDDEEDQ